MKFNFSKRYGQNFLTDKNLLSAIVADSKAGADDTVVEVGAGAGALTVELAKAVKRVISYEIDTRLKDILSAGLAQSSNVEIVFEDILKAKVWENLDGYRVVANLPYYITTPILFYFLECSNPPKSMTVMVQEEVARRMTAEPGTPDYGALSVSIALRGTAVITRKVGRNMFVPPPNVDSAVVRIELDKARDTDYTDVTKVIRAAFGMRRKTLVNCLMTLGINKDTALGAVRACGLDDAVRGERLGRDDFVRLTKAIYS